MSKQQHTQGPWRADVSPTETHGVFARFNIRTDDRVSIASGQSQEHLGEAGIHEQEMLANVRLIVVAPELLEDLVEAASTLRRYEALHRAKNTEESTAKAEVNAALATRFEATIARAKGEQA